MDKIPMTVEGEKLLRDELHELKTVKRPMITEAIKEAREEQVAFKPIEKTPEEKTSYKVNQKLLLISLCAMALSLIHI